MNPKHRPIGVDKPRTANHPRGYKNNKKIV